MRNRLALMGAGVGVCASWLLAALVAPSVSHGAEDEQQFERRVLDRLGAPLLFVKRHSYTGIHIYDTYYKWPPGGGGIYVLENPRAPRVDWKIRPLVDSTTPGSPGSGVYSHPELTWDARHVLFCFKGEPEGSTKIYRVAIDGTDLKCLSDPTIGSVGYHGRGGGQHDLAPAALPDGRVVFLSTRQSGLVPCNNTGVAVLHVMNADGTDVHSISVNNVNEFDPSVLPDGRILFGRWEYVDKNALTIQSLWTIHADGTEETALFANNMVFPEAILDARPVPGSHRIVGTLAKHNGPPRGSVAVIDPLLGKNNPAAIANLEHPAEPTHDTGESCEPWPLSDDLVLYSGRPSGASHNVIQAMDRSGRRAVLLSDPAICLHSPMLVQPRPLPATTTPRADRRAATGRFFVQNIYAGLPGVRRGEVAQLRVIEETSRVSGSPGSPNPYNQTFLVSAALAFSVKNFLGVAPVEADGSAYFEVPAGKALYFQALDREGRLIQSMRTFVQATPGVTRSCIGCHEHKSLAPTNHGARALALSREPSRLQKESWGHGPIDYPRMIQPVWDRHCVSCHGGKEGIAAGLDLSGGWTEHFNISYENLVNRRQSQLTAYWIAGIDCMNGTAHWSTRIFPPRGHGSGAAPLAELLLAGHQGRIANLTRAERDLVLAWIDTNGLYYGTWDTTEHGYALPAWNAARQKLSAAMQTAGCGRCHAVGGPITRFEPDWINLQTPEQSRILRAPLAAGDSGLGLGLCRDRPVDSSRPRVRLLWNGYAHAVLPLDQFPMQRIVAPDTSGATVASLSSPDDPHYQAMLGIIRAARDKATAAPRVDMPGAKVVVGECRTNVPTQVDRAP
ncbi:MAG: hypothetical protein DCC67_05615 [Planctomycetota bacterium]|nr:MAG: hypothetical protein DCC67_05615 [Planctomycetota bacterium]